MVNIMIQTIIRGMLLVLHPFYISVVDINHNAKESLVEISVRVFSEDMEKNLKKYSNQKIDINNPKDKSVVDKQISNYLIQHLKLTINGQPGELHYLGYEIQQESAWCYFEVEKIKEVKKMEIDCSILYDFEKTQTNILHVKSKGIEKSIKLDNPQKNAVFEF